MLLTIKIFDSIDVVLSESKICTVRLILGVHNRVGLRGVSQAKGVAYFVCSNRQQVHFIRVTASCELFIRVEMDLANFWVERVCDHKTWAIKWRRIPVRARNKPKFIVVGVYDCTMY